MELLFEILNKQVGKHKSRQYLANTLGVSYQSVKKWCDAGYMPLRRAVECEYLFDVPRASLMDPDLYEMVTDTVAM